MPLQLGSPHGCTKVYVSWSSVNYRETYNLFACNGILLNDAWSRLATEYQMRRYRV